ncbi:MAG: hypothetical protein K2X87_22510 [Gemmataceae bacterium]|nr:hypothetical protein [Gemmataceae bacterium]
MFGLVAFLLIGCPHDDPPPAGNVRVTVVAVLATADNATVDPKLTDLAKEVRKRDKSLTGFRVAKCEAKSIPVGESLTFCLVEKQELTVTVDRPKDKDGRVGLTIQPPEMGEITYLCTCDKYFPVVTPYKTKAGETLIVLVMGKPCTGKNK